MKVDMVMPQMGESIAEGTILRWIKKQGDVVEKDENILEISTDKVDSEIPAPAAGRIVAVLANEGETVPVGKVVAQIETEAGAAVPPAPAAPKPAEPAPAPATPAPAEARPPKSEGRPAEVATSAAAPVIAGGGPVAGSGPVASRDGSGRFYSPLVRSIARAEGIGMDELAGLQGTGRDGRLTKDDLMTYVERRKGGPVAMPRPQLPREPELRVAEMPAAPPQPPSAGRPAPARGGVSTAAVKPSETRSTPDGAIDVVPMDHVRQKIAEHMVRSKATSPHVASVTEVDMTRVVRWREANKAAFERSEGFKLTYTPVFVQAVVKALKEFPYVNSSIEGTNILVKRFVNIGVAVSVDYGLIVPVIKGADTLSFLGVARAVNDLAARARSKQLKPDEVAGGTFSITNMGTVGTLFGVPIIAQPQVGILGIGAIQKRPVVRDDAIAIRDMMYMCLSYDHRIIDGAMGGSFIERVAHHLETMEL